MDPRTPRTDAELDAQLRAGPVDVEAYERTAGERAYSAELARLYRAVRTHTDDEEVLDAIAAARAAGVPWQEIGDVGEHQR